MYFPCRNEAAHLPGVLSRVPSFVDEIIVVSNCSTDDTVAVAESEGSIAVVDDRTTNGVGYGYAHMTGMAKASGDLIVGADGDNEHPIEELSVVLDHLLDHDLDVLTCARYPVPKGNKIPFKLRLGVHLLNLEVRLLYGRRVDDILAGMWVMRAPAVDALGLTMGDWNLSPQVKLNAIQSRDLRFAELHLPQRRRIGVSHQQYFHTGLSHAWWILKNRFVGTRSRLDS